MKGAFATWLLVVAVGVLSYAIIRLRRHERALEELLWFTQRRQRAVLDFLNHIGDRFRTRLDLDHILESILEFVMESTQARSGAVFLIAPEDPNALHARVVQGLFPPLHHVSDKALARPQYLAEKIKKERVKIGEGLVGTVALETKPLLLSNARGDSRVPASARAVVEVETLMAAPLIARKDLLGVIVLVNSRQEGGAFSEMDLSLLCALADQAAITVDWVQVYKELGEKHRLEQELELAHKLQQMLLPQTFPDIDGLEFAGYSEPAQEVGGDYYDIFEVDAHRLGFAIADVAGKGIPGALLMANVRSILRAEARGDPSPKAVLTRVNRLLLKDTSSNLFVTMTYGVLDLRTFDLKFARAGHEPLIVCGPAVQNGLEERPRLYSPNGIALGLVNDDTFHVTEEAEARLRPQEVAVLYTDGVVESPNKAEEEYGAERLIETLRTNSSRSAPEILSAVQEDLREFTKGLSQRDDVTLLILKVLHAPVEQIQSEPEARAARA